jgi:hypothetical protein
VSKSVILLLLVVMMCSCQNQISNSFTQKYQRESFIAEKSRFIDSVFLYLPNPGNENKYQSAFWASELMLKKSSTDIINIEYACIHFKDYSDNFKRILLQHIYTLYPENFKHQVDSLIRLELDEKRFAIMANYLIRMDSSNIEFTNTLMKKKFLNWNDNPILKAFSDSQTAGQSITKSQITDLFAFTSKLEKAVLFVFVNKNRDLPGYLIIQNKKGEILTENGDTLKFRLLARSITNMPEYITNGNTPQGVFAVIGFSNSENVFIGKTPTIISALPFETSLSEFSSGKFQGNWDLEQYNKFYPESWKNYLPKNRAFYAGKAGRSEIILHGTTIDTDFYKAQSFYPFTPSLGCLCLLERWNSMNGYMIESDQLKLVNILKKNGINKALMYVIEK